MIRNYKTCVPVRHDIGLATPMGICLQYLASENLLDYPPELCVYAQQNMNEPEVKASLF